MKPLLLVISVALATFAGVRWHNAPQPGLLDFIVAEPQTDWVAIVSAVGAVITALEALVGACSKLWKLFRGSEAPQSPDEGRS